MSGPYSQEQYERAKKALAGGGIPPEKVPVVQQRITQYEDDRARGYLPPPAAKSPEVDIATDNALNGMNSWLTDSKSETADVIRAAMPPEQLEARRQSVDFGKKLATDDKLQTASKLKVFSDPPEYTPPSLPGLTGLLPKASLRYFEPTADEFRRAVEGHDALKQRLQAGFPDTDDLAKVPDEQLVNSEAYKAFADARWQSELARAMREKQPIIRVAFSSKDWMGGGKDASGNPKPSAADLMDSTMALGVGALQGGSLGAYDLGLTATGANEIRDEGRGSMERHPGFATAGKVLGALSPRSAPARLTAGLGRLLPKPASLVGRIARGAAVGAGTAVIDDNTRAIADKAAEALDARDTAAEAVARIREGLPGFRSAGLGAAVGGGADLVGAGLGALANAAPKALGLNAPLAHLEASGGKIGPMGGPVLSREAQGLADLAASRRTTAQDMIAEDAVQPMARQIMLEQEAAKRAAKLETEVAQANLEGVDMPTKQTALGIRAEAAAIRPITALAAKQKKDLLEIADRLAQQEKISVGELDDYIQQLDEQAGQGKVGGEPTRHLNQASKRLRDLRDQFAHMDEKTIADVPPPEDRGLFTQNADDTLVEPQPRRVAGIRDSEGNVKPVEGYSALKAQQYKDRTLQEFKNASILGNRGRPRQLTAEPVISEPTVDKGLFNVESPEEMVSKVTPKVALSKAEHDALKGNIRKIAQPDDLADASEILSLAKRVGPDMEKKLRVIQQLEDADKLASALGRTIQGVSARGNNVSAFVDRRQLFRAVPTLKSLAGGLPAKSDLLASDGAVKRFKQFLAGIDEKGGFMPTSRRLGLRAGLPARVIGSAQSEDPEAPEKFSDEERRFWMQVLENLTTQGE